jgi:hypothetical protein
MLIDQFRDEPREVLGRQPLIQRRRQQKSLIRIEMPKRLAHRALQPRPRHPDRPNVEQSPIAITWHTQ